MDREEDFLKQKFGKTRSFRVPEGYFDAFASSIMEQLPENVDGHDMIIEEKAKVVPLKARWRRVARVAAAACLCGLLFGVGTMFMNRTDGNTSQYVSANNQLNTSTSELDQMADYTMIDVGDMYAYVSDY